jgi:hypothetical protein
MKRQPLARKAVAIFVTSLALTLPALRASADAQLEGTLLASGLIGSIGGGIGPDRALYVPQGGLGEITRIDIATGDTSTYASGLPAAFPLVGIGGPMDVAFIGRTAYVLVSLVGDPAFGGAEKDGIYRVNRDGTVELVADLGQFNQDNPPPLGSLDPSPPEGQFNYFLVNGVQYALQRSGDGFLVSDGHLNRILHVNRRGISIVKSYGDVVPTGMATAGGRLYLAQTGPIVDDEEIGGVTSFHLYRHSWDRTVASDISMAVDVEFGPHGQLYALSQGAYGGGDPGAPAAPNTGQLLKINGDGSATVLADGINRPTSLHFLGSTALVVTLAGDVWKFDVSDCDRRGHERRW